MPQSTKPFCIIFHQKNTNIKNCDESKYLKLTPINKKHIDELEKYEEIFDNIIKVDHLIKSKSNKSDDHDDNYMKIKIKSDGKLPSE